MSISSPNDDLLLAAEEAWSKGKFQTFTFLSVTQPIGDFYVVSMPCQVLASLAHNDIRRMSKDIDDYMGLQRRLNEVRVAQLREYVARMDAVFPTAIIIHVQEDFVRIDAESKTLQIVQLQGVAQVLDGQHRLAGLASFKERFDLNVVIFVGLDLEDQANIFATINIEQTKVNKSLVYDLYAFAQSKSPQRTAHRVVVKLDRDTDSALQGRIKRLGFAEGDSARTVTQAVLVEGMLKHMSENPGLDRDILKRGGRASDLPQYPGLKLRPLWLDDNPDDKIHMVMREYFKAVAARWPEAWAGLQGFMLCRTNGIRALLRAFPVALGDATISQDVVRERFRAFFAEQTLQNDDFTPIEFYPGTGGETKLYRRLVRPT